MHSTHNEEKSHVAEQLVRTLKKRIYNFNTYKRTSKIKTIDDKSNSKSTRKKKN